MKKIILSLIVIATISYSAQAQTRRNNGNKGDSAQSTQNENRKKHGKGNHKPMADNLQFTDEQKQQMKAINTDFKSRMTALKSANFSAEEMKTKRTAILQERKEKMQALLTPDQKKKMSEYKAKYKDNEKGDHAKKAGRMHEKLDLSSEQREKMKAQKEAYKSKEEAIKNNQALSTEQKNAQMKALHEERKNSFRSLLTPEQVKKIEEMKHKKSGKAA